MESYVKYLSFEVGMLASRKVDRNQDRKYLLAGILI